MNRMGRIYETFGGPTTASGGDSPHRGIRCARNPRVFGAVVYGEDTEESYLDILVDPTPETSIFDIGEIRYQLRTLLGVSVDVLTPQALHIRLRDQILSEALPV